MTDREIHGLNGTDAVDRWYESPERDYREEQRRDGRDCVVNSDHSAKLRHALDLCTVELKRAEDAREADERRFCLESLARRARQLAYAADFLAGQVTG